MWNKNTAAVAAGHSVDVARWEDAFGEVIDRIASRFARYEPLRHAASLMQGLLAPLERKNCWTIAEFRGDASPDALQHLLARAKWDADAVRDDLRDYVVDHLGDPGAVLVIDETGDLKKGTDSVGVQRQYTGTAGRIENAQVAVYVTYAAARGHAFIDRALYLPRAWTEDPQRRAAAGVPAQVRFATKPALAAAMITRAVRAGAPAAWVAGDEVYGADPQLRATIRRRGLGYVMQIAANRAVPTDAGPVRVDQLPALIPAHAWQIASAAAGSKGPRLYSWAWIDIAAEQDPQNTDDTEDSDDIGAAEDADAGAGVTDSGGQHGVLIRRNDKTGELAYHRCYAPTPTPLQTLICVAGQRWRIEESFQAGKGLTGLDQHQVRRWASWHRWTTLAMLAHAFLTVATAHEREHTTTPNGLITLTVAEFRRLFTAFLLRGKQTITTVLGWSHWRRRHQARARDCHYRRRQRQ